MVTPLQQVKPHHNRALLRKLDGVTGQIHQHLLQSHGIPHQTVGYGRINVNHQLQVFIGGGSGHDGGEGFHHITQPERCMTQLHFACFDFRHIQHIVQQCQQRSAGCGNHPHMIRLILIQRGITEQLSRPQYCIQRRADFVTHVRQELGFGAVRTLRQITGTLEGSLCLFLFRNVVHVDDGMQHPVQQQRTVFQQGFELFSVHAYRQPLLFPVRTLGSISGAVMGEFRQEPHNITPQHGVITGKHLMSTTVGVDHQAFTVHHQHGTRCQLEQGFKLVAHLLRQFDLLFQHIVRGLDFALGDFLLHDVTGHTQVTGHLTPVIMNRRYRQIDRHPLTILTFVSPFPGHRLTLAGLGHEHFKTGYRVPQLLREP